MNFGCKFLYKSDNLFDENIPYLTFFEYDILKKHLLFQVLLIFLKNCS